MKDYSGLLKRLYMRARNEIYYSGVQKEAADAAEAIKNLMRVREALLSYIEGDCEHCAKQDSCEHFNLFHFPETEECEWEWDEDY